MNQEKIFKEIEKRTSKKRLAVIKNVDTNEIYFYNIRYHHQTNICLHIDYWNNYIHYFSYSDKKNIDDEINKYLVTKECDLTKPFINYIEIEWSIDYPKEIKDIFTNEIEKYISYKIMEDVLKLFKENDYKIYSYFKLEYKNENVSIYSYYDKYFNWGYYCLYINNKKYLTYDELRDKYWYSSKIQLKTYVNNNWDIVIILGYPTDNINNLDWFNYEVSIISKDNGEILYENSFEKVFTDNTYNLKDRTWLDQCDAFVKMYLNWDINTLLY